MHRQLALVIKKQAAEICKAVSLLHVAKGMEQHLLNIQRLENDADDIYFRAMAELFKESDAVKLIKYKELYDMLENATDKCEYVGNIIESHRPETQLKWINTRLRWRSSS